MRCRLALLLGLAGLLAACSGAGDRPSTEQDVSRFDLRIAREGSALVVPYCSTSSISANAGATRLLVVVHGDQRNACEYAAWAVAAAQRAGAGSDTAVVAPHFVTQDDPESERDDVLYWSDEGWKAGANSRDEPFDRPWRVSAFAVVDELIVRAVETMPELDDVVVAGHSAGGQFVQRYAASTAISDSVRFVVANPSSYLYLDGRRWIEGELREPDDEEVDDCPGYDAYKYGLDDRYEYLEDRSRDEIRQQYGSRRVDYLLGAEDTDTSGGNLDESCAARLQGASRLERGRLFLDAVHEWYGRDEVDDRHRVATVPDVGHDAEEMITSAVGREVLFGS